MKIPNLSRLFKRTEKHAGGLAICMNGSGVHFAQVKHTGSKPQVLMCAFHTAAEVTSDVLEKLCKELHLGGSQVATLLAPGEYQMLLVDTPNIPVEEMKKAIRWRIKDSLDYPVEEAAVDVLKIPAGNEGGGERPQALYAIAARNNIIQQRIELFEKAKLDLRVIDIPEMAQRNIAALFEEEEKGLALLSFSDNGGLLTFTKGGELYLARRIEITMQQLQHGDEDMRQQYQDRLVMELERSMDYFGRQYSYIPVQRLLVAAPEQLRLVQLLASDLDIPVVQLDLAQVLDIGATPELAGSEQAAQAFLGLGAALRQERRAL